MSYEQDDQIDGQQEILAGASLGFFEATMLGVLDSLPFYVMLIDRHHRILLVNRAVRRQLGLEPEEILGHYCPQIVHGIEDGTYDGCPLAEAVRTQQPVEREHYDEFQERWLNIGIYPTSISTPDGEKIYFHMVADVTEKKQAQNALAGSEEKHRMLLEELLKSTRRIPEE